MKKILTLLNLTPFKIVKTLWYGIPFTFRNHPVIQSKLFNFSKKYHVQFQFSPFLAYFPEQNTFFPNFLVFHLIQRNRKLSPYTPLIFFCFEKTLRLANVNSDNSQWMNTTAIIFSLFHVVCIAIISLIILNREEISKQKWRCNNKYTTLRNISWDGLLKIYKGLRQVGKGRNTNNDHDNDN